MAVRDKPGDQVWSLPATRDDESLPLAEGQQQHSLKKSDQRRHRLADWPATAALICLLLALSVWIAWPLVLGYRLPSDDGQFHLARLFELDRAIRSGVIFPRLAPDLALGYGYPVFVYYPPLAAYIGALGALLGLSHVSAYDAVYVFTLALAALGMFFFLRQSMGQMAAAAGAAAYAFAPYSITDIFVRGAQAEFLALGILPWHLLILDRLATRRTFANFIATAVAVALLVLAHNITALIALPLLFGYFLVAAAGRDSVRRLPRAALGLAAAVLLGIALSAFYWLPALWEQGAVNIEELTKGSFWIASHLRDWDSLIQGTLAYEYWPAPERAFRPGLVQMLIAAAGFLRALWLPALRRRAIFFGLVIAACLWFQQPGSLYLWDTLPLARFVQFSWRLMVFITLGTAWCSGALLVGWTTRQAKPSLASRAVSGARLALASGLTAAMLLASLPGLQIVPGPDSYTDIQPSVPTLVRRELQRRLVAVVTGGEYIPATTTVSPFDYVVSDATKPEPQEQPAAAVRIERVSYLDLEAAVDAAAPYRLVLDRVHFPGWQATVDGTAVPVSPWGPLGQVSWMVPAGSHKVVLRFSDTPVRTVGWLVAWLALCAIVVMIVVAHRRLSLTRLRQCPKSTACILFMLAGLAILALLPLLVSGAVGLAASGRRAIPVRAVFDNQIALAGADLDYDQVDGGGPLGVTLFWHALRAPQREYRIRLRLADGTGMTVGERNKRPFFGLRRTALWPAGMLVRDYQEVRLDPGVPRGEYQLFASVVDEATGQQLNVVLDPGDTPSTPGGTGQAQGQAREVLVGRVTLPSVAMAAEPAIAHQLRADFAGKLRLLGFDMTSPSEDRARDVRRPYLAAVRPGDSLSFVAFFQSLADTDDDYLISSQILDMSGRKISQHDDLPGRGNRPTSVWLKGEVHAHHLYCQVPENAPPGRHALTMSAYYIRNNNRVDWHNLQLDDGSGDRVTLGYIKVRGAPYTDGYRPVGGPPGILAAWAQLDGVKIDRREDGRLAISLLWSSLGQAESDYTVFVHVLDSRGQLVAQHDGQPDKGGYPTTYWEPGDRVEDEHVLSLPAPFPAGEYRVVVGMYLLATGQRLKAADGRDALAAGSFVFPGSP